MVQGHKINLKNAFFGTPPPLKLITFVLETYKVHMGARSEANKMLPSEIYRSHTDKVVLVSVSPAVTSDLQFLTKRNFSAKKYIYRYIWFMMMYSNIQQTVILGQP